MPKYAVYAIYTASKFLGEFEAETEEKAIDVAEDEAATYVSLCHQCARELELGDAYEFQATKIEQ